MASATGTVERGGIGATLAPYFRPMPFVAFLLGISSGFPLTLLLATMTYWLSKVGIVRGPLREPA